MYDLIDALQEELLVMSELISISSNNKTEDDKQTAEHNTFTQKQQQTLQLNSKSLNYFEISFQLELD